MRDAHVRQLEARPETRTHAPPPIQGPGRRVSYNSNNANRLGQSTRLSTTAKPRRSPRRTTSRRAHLLDRRLGQLHHQDLIERAAEERELGRRWKWKVPSARPAGSARGVGVGAPILHVNVECPSRGARRAGARLAVGLHEPGA